MILPLDALALAKSRHTMTSMNDNHLNLYITTNYAVTLTALYLVMTLRVVYLRRSLKIAFGNLGNLYLLRAIRAHANFSEYTPLALVLLLLLEVMGLQNALLHGLGMLLLTGRLAHALGISRERAGAKLRVTGMVLTVSMLLFEMYFLIWLQM